MIRRAVFAGRISPIFRGGSALPLTRCFGSAQDQTSSSHSHSPSAASLSVGVGSTRYPRAHHAAVAITAEANIAEKHLKTLFDNLRRGIISVQQGGNSAASVPIDMAVLAPRNMTANSLVQMLRLLSFRHAASSGSSGGGNNNNKGNDDNNANGSGLGSVPPIDEESPEAWLVPRVCLFVLAVFILTVILYKLARPSGIHVGWNSLKNHVSEISYIALYEHYAQVYLDDGKVHLGLYHDQDTQRHIDEVGGLYSAARHNAKQEEMAAHIAKTSEALAAGKKKDGDTAVAEASTFSSDKPDELQVVFKGRPTAESVLYGVGVVAWVVPFVFLPVFVMFLSQYIGKSMSYAVEATKGKTQAKEMIFKIEKSSKTRFRDIAGMKEPKKEITEIVDFLRHPERYTRLGAKIPTGGLLLGPPGTGKTLLAKAVAGESGVGFIPVCGSDFVELYVGMGALRVRQLFAEAKKQRCIIYIDEIDAIGLKRQGAGHGEKQEQEQTLNELLTQLDGFSSSKRGEIMVLASSNVSQEALDPALIRPGRFDRIIHVDTPVISERIDIFKVHLSNLKLVADSDLPETPADAEKKEDSEDNDKNKNNNISNSSSEEEAQKEYKDAKKDDSSAEEKKVLEASATTVQLAIPPPAATETPKPIIKTSAETSLVLSSLEENKKSDGDLLAEEKEGGHFSFDFRSLLLHKSDRERALIDAYAERMSNLCPGFVGADIANVCNEGAILAAREEASYVDITHLERSIDRVIAGIEHRSRVLSPFEKNVVAHHEAGHAVAGWFLNRADPLMKVSIVPRGGSALGYAQYLPNENYTRTAKELRESISVTLGGRVAEKIFFNHLSTGASDDLRKVSNMAYMYVASFNPGSVYPAPGTSATRLTKPFGAKRSNKLDEEAKKLVEEIYKETYTLLLKHKADMEMLAQHLLKHELLTYQDVVNYLGVRGERQRDKRKGV